MSGRLKGADVMLKAVLIWLAVLIPLAWGVSRSLEKARPLFHDALAVVDLPRESLARGDLGLKF